MNYPFKLIENTEEYVVLKNIQKSELDIQKYPYIDMNTEYLAITKGIDHTLTIYKKDGHTFSFDYDEYGHTMVSSKFRRLAGHAGEYLKSIGISIVAETIEQPDYAEFYYSNQSPNWRATLKYSDDRHSEDYYRSSTAKNELEMLDELREVFNYTFSDLKYGKPNSNYMEPVWMCKGDRGIVKGLNLNEFDRKKDEKVEALEKELVENYDLYCQTRDNKTYYVTKDKQNVLCVDSTLSFADRADLMKKAIQNNVASESENAYIFATADNREALEDLWAIYPGTIEGYFLDAGEDFEADFDEYCQEFGLALDV